MGHAIFFSVSGNTPATVDVKFNVTNTGTGDAVLVTSVNGLNSFYLDNTSATNPVVTQNGSGDGVHLIASGGALVSSVAASGQTSQGVFLQTDAGTEIKANAGNAVTASYTGTGGGAGAGADVVTVIAHGALGDGSNVLGATGVSALVSGGGAGNVNVTASQIYSSLTAVIAQTNGTGNVTVATDPGASYVVSGGDGINAAITSSAGKGAVAVHAENNMNTVGTGVVAANVGGGSGGSPGSSNGVTVDYGGSATKAIAMTAAGGGITAQIGNGSLANNDNVVVNIGGGSASASITASGGRGVFAATNGAGNVTVNEASNASIVTTTGTNLDGVDAENLGGVGGALTVNIAGSINATGAGVQLANQAPDTGAMNVNTGPSSVITAVSTGILAVNSGAGGNVTISAQGMINAGAAGIDAEINNASNTGAVTVVASGAVSGQTGVQAVANGSGLVDVETSNDVTGSNGGVVSSTASGSNTVHVHDKGGSLATISTSTGDAISATAAGSGALTVITDADTDLEAGGRGVSATTNSGTLSVTVNGSVGAAAAVGQAILAASGTGSVAVATGAASIHSSGDGVFAQSGGAKGVMVTVSTGTGSIKSDSGNGVSATASSAGSITITTAGSVSGGADGVLATVSKGKVTLANQAGGAISGASTGVSITGKGVVTNDAGGSISGGKFGLVISSKTGTVVNAGTISGATASVEFTGSGANKLTLKTGSILSGDAIGSTAAGATNALALTGHGTAANNFVNFNTLTVTAQKTGRWVLDGSSAIGTTTINSGALQVGDLAHTSAQLSGAVTVAATGTLTGDGTVAGAVANQGLLSATDVGGVLDITGAVTGSGSAKIAAGSLRFGSSFTQNVTFTGTSGILDLANSQGYGGTITGFSHSGGTQIDLRDIGFVSAGQATFSGTSASGVLTVTDGTHMAKINLFGNYLASTFVAASDGHGGTLVHDPAAAGAQLASPSAH
jgi:hypothetical protein